MIVRTAAIFLHWHEKDGYLPILWIVLTNWVFRRRKPLMSVKLIPTKMESMINSAIVSQGIYFVRKQAKVLGGAAMNHTHMERQDFRNPISIWSFG